MSFERPLESLQSAFVFTKVGAPAYGKCPETLQLRCGLTEIVPELRPLRHLARGLHLSP